MNAPRLDILSRTLPVAWARRVIDRARSALSSMLLRSRQRSELAVVPRLFDLVPKRD